MPEALRWFLDQVWPFCGWQPGRRHELAFGRVLTITAEAICQRCDRRWMVHEQQPGMLPWSDDVERFFRRRAPGEAGDAG